MLTRSGYPFIDQQWGSNNDEIAGLSPMQPKFNANPATLCYESGKMTWLL